MAEVYKQLDFWIGTWDVRLPNGTLAGTDTVEKSLDGCIVFEHWTDARGSKGESVFYYHPGLKTWKQVRVTPFGVIKEKQLTAAQDAGAVRFAGEAVAPDGRSTPDRTTLIPQPDGTVRQVIEQSTDGGRTWQTTFDAIYTRR